MLREMNLKLSAERRNAANGTSRAVGSTAHSHITASPPSAALPCSALDMMQSSPLPYVASRSMLAMIEHQVRSAC